MQFRLRTVFALLVIGGITTASIARWLRRPVTSNTLDGQSFQLAGPSALLYCVMTSDADTLSRMLMMQKYDLDKTASPEQWTLLQHALLHECLDTTTLLLKHGANPNYANKGTPTPLELARRAFRQDLVDVLLEYGAKDLNSPP
ncbi:MAG: ankyrin repeat domain-containing protein [Planctomycetales bacterium]|nr:ankyrin repeat domain-containing protein [Planctomycetales bacterium]